MDEEEGRQPPYIMVRHVRLQQKASLCQDPARWLPNACDTGPEVSGVWAVGYIPCLLGEVGPRYDTVKVQVKYTVIESGV